MKIISIRDGQHDGSLTVVENGIIKDYLKEERFSKVKRDGSSKLIFEKLLENYIDTCDVIHFSLYDQDLTSIHEKVRQQNKNIEIIEYPENNTHHLYHASMAFYNSGFEKSLVIVIDSSEICGETVYLAEYPDRFTPIYFGATLAKSTQYYTFDSICNIYDTTTRMLGLSTLDSGKTMGLSSYGERIPNCCNFFGSKSYPSAATVPIWAINSKIYRYLIQNALDKSEKVEITKENHKIYAHYCKEIQVQTQTAVAKLVEKLVEETGIKNICISGGYGMNVVSNYNLVKTFPDLNFYFEPLCDDGGVSIGSAMYFYRKFTKDTTIYPLNTTSFHGFEYDVKQYSGTTKSIEEVAKILYENKSVAVYTGLSEGGQRALGNRSILFNALHSDAKDIVNQIKKREWYRPFAAVVLEEDANLYFDMGNVKSSPFMTMCFPVKSELIPGVTHIDNTCRVQTVSSGYLYELLLEFKKISGHGILLNTSFNLSEEPLVETPEDAFNTLHNSSLDYLWFEETKQLFS